VKEMHRNTVRGCARSNVCVDVDSEVYWHIGLNTLLYWKEFRNDFGNKLRCLDLHRLPHILDPTCLACGTHIDISFQCTKCRYGHMMCGSCMCEHHEHAPLLNG
jgi:hypothetical protein